MAGRFSWPRARYKLHQYLTAYLFILTAAVLYGVFVLRPTVQTFWLALYDWDGVAADRAWVGLDNFRRLFSDPIFWQALWHSLIWTTMVVVFNVTVGLVAAALLASNIRGRILFRLGYFLPVVQASIVTAMIWLWIYAPNGILNTLLNGIGLDFLARGWLGDFIFALPSLAVAASWMSFGMSVIILLAGMQGVDPTLHDAARVDGAASWQVFLHITIPSLRNVITIVVLLSLMDGFQVFDIVWATTEGGPVRATEVLSTYMFKAGFMQSRYGFGSAIAVTLAIIIFVTSVGYLLIQERGDD
ncbi:MAG: sugar ABC transporter permease [Chloroflexi bacterium]|nr:sugar ABC transporter permease [Chloroflexota bacterium]